MGGGGGGGENDILFYNLSFQGKSKPATIIRQKNLKIPALALRWSVSRRRRGVH